MKNVNQSDIQLAALRSARFLSTKIKGALMKEAYSASANFILFDFYNVIPNIPYVDKKDFFKDIEFVATKFFMEWFSADTEVEMSVRRRIALQAVTDTIKEDFWKNFVLSPDLPRDLSSVIKVLERYDEKYEEKRKTEGMFSAGTSMMEFFQEHQFLKTAKQLGGVVSCDKNTLVQAVQQQFAGDLTEHFNQMLSSLNVTTPFVHSNPGLSNKTLEQRLAEKRGKDLSTTATPPVQPSN